MQLQTTWGFPIAIYFFLGGLGAGSFCVVALIALFTGERFRPTVRFGAWASSICIAVGVGALLFEVGVPLLAIVLFQAFVNLNSWMAIGAWLLFFAILFNGLFALLWTDWVLKWLDKRVHVVVQYRAVIRFLLAMIGIGVNVGVAVYTGILLNVLPFRPFWNTYLLPVLFTTSAIDTGLGLITAYATLREKSNGVEKLRTVLESCVVLAIIAEGAVLIYYMRTMLESTTEAAQSAKLVMDGFLSPVFWVFVMGLGLLVPFLICMTQLSGMVKRAPMAVPLTAVTSCLIGGFALRAVMLMAGLPQTLSSPALLQILQGVRFSP